MVIFFRRDVVYFGIDEYGDSLLTYYKVTSFTFYIVFNIIIIIKIIIIKIIMIMIISISQCTDGDCVEINDMKCNRTCDSAKFDISAANYILLEVLILIFALILIIIIMTIQLYQLHSHRHHPPHPNTVPDT